MTFYDIAHESWLSISGNKMRSFLTVLGIVIDVSLLQAANAASAIPIVPSAITNEPANTLPLYPRHHPSKYRIII